MKKKLALITMMIAAFAITTVKAQTPVTTQADWKEKNDFHVVMAQTFHPSEKGNYEPIRTRIGEMYDKAIAWANSTPPKEFDSPQLKSTLKELVGQIMSLKGMITNKATNDELKPKLEALHETFHKIVGMCSKEEHTEDRKTDPAKKDKE